MSKPQKAGVYVVPLLSSEPIVLDVNGATSSASITLSITEADALAEELRKAATAMAKARGWMTAEPA